MELLPANQSFDVPGIGTFTGGSDAGALLANFSTASAQFELENVALLVCVMFQDRVELYGQDRDDIRDTLIDYSNAVLPRPTTSPTH